METGQSDITQKGGMEEGRKGRKEGREGWKEGRKEGRRRCKEI